MPGVHVQGKVRGDIGGHTAQHRRPAGGNPQSDSSEGQPEPAGQRQRRPGRERALVQVARRRQGEHEGTTDANLALRKGRPEVQELRESARFIKIKKILEVFCLNILFIFKGNERFIHAHLSDGWTLANGIFEAA